MLLPVFFVKTKGRQNCRPLQLDCVRGYQKDCFLSGTATKRLSYKDNASEKGKSITEDGFGRKEKIQPLKCETATQEELDFEILIKQEFFKWCPEPESNQRHVDFQSTALPTELSGH